MKRTAKLVHSTLRWKRKNCSSSALCHSDDVRVDIDDDEACCRALLDSDTKQTIIFPPNQICSIKQSPYRILKVGQVRLFNRFCFYIICTLELLFAIRLRM